MRACEGWRVSSAHCRATWTQCGEDSSVTGTWDAAGVLPMGAAKGMGDSLTQKSSSYLETTGSLLTIKTQLFFFFFHVVCLKHTHLGQESPAFKKSAQVRGHMPIGPRPRAPDRA